jgi:hypothetical protein
MHCSSGFFYTHCFWNRNPNKYYEIETHEHNNKKIKEE